MEDMEELNEEEIRKILEDVEKTDKKINDHDRTKMEKLQQNSIYKIELKFYPATTDTLNLIAQNNGPFKKKCIREQSLGLNVEVFWLRNSGWLSGTVIEYLEDKDEYRVCYDEDNNTSDEYFEDLLFTGESYKKKKDQLVKAEHGPNFHYEAADRIFAEGEKHLMENIIIEEEKNKQEKGKNKKGKEKKEKKTRKP